MGLLKDISSLWAFCGQHPVVAALALLIALGVWWWKRRNPLVMDLKNSAVQRDLTKLLPALGIKGFANVRRVRVRNPTAATSVPGVTVKLDLCVQQPTHAIKLQRDGGVEHPFTIDGDGEVYINVIAQIPGATEFVFLYDPGANEPATIRKRRLDLVIGMTVTGRRKKKFKVSVSEDGSGNLDLYESRLPRRSS